MLSKKQYQEILKALPASFLILQPKDFGYKVVQVNGGRKFTGLPKDLLLSKNFPEDLISSTTIYGDSKELKKSLQQVLKSKRSHQFILEYPPGEKWLIENIPVTDENGSVDLILHTLHKLPRDEGIVSEYTIEDLLEQREYYKSLFKYHSDGVFSLDLEGRFQTVNNSLARMAEREPNDLINKSFQPFLVPEEIEMVNQHITEAIGGEVQNYDCNVVNEKGNILTLNVTNIPIRVGSKIVGIFGIAKDITKEKYYEQLKLDYEIELKNVNKRLIGILESITDGFFTVDKNAIVTYWNKEAERISKISRSYIIGKNLWNIYNKSFVKYFNSAFKNVIEQQKPVHFEEYFSEIDFWLEIHAYPSEEGMSVYFRDVTEKKRAAELIRVSKERYDYLSKVTNDAIWDWDILNDRVHRSEAFQTLFGLDRNDENILTPDHWSDRLHAEDAERVIKSLTEARTSPDKVLWQEEYRYRKADGSYANIHDRALLIRNEEGNVIRMIGAMRDITDRKKSELMLKQLNAELESRAEELLASNTELERFAYIASHDLKEPLRMITGFLQMLQKRSGPQLDETANMYINYAMDGSSRMQKLIKDLLLYSQTANLENAKETTDLNELLKEVQLNLIRQIEENRATIYVEGTMPELIVYKSAISRLFQNLINNAIKFRKPGEPPVISINAHEGKEHWTFSIKDNGIGMKEKHFQRIFEIFSRLHTKDQYPGSGIGLAICKKIVKQHQGEIWVESRESQGSTFYFTIKK